MSTKKKPENLPGWIADPQNEGDEHWNLWLEYKLERREEYKKTGITLMRNLRNKWGDEKFIAAVVFSATSSYKGLIKAPKTKLIHKSAPTKTLAEIEADDDEL